jgi:hypothetical protein
LWLHQEPVSERWYICVVEARRTSEEGCENGSFKGMLTNSFIYKYSYASYATS